MLEHLVPKGWWGGKVGEHTIDLSAIIKDGERRVRGSRTAHHSPAFALPTAIALAGISLFLPLFVRPCPSGSGNSDSRMLFAHVPHERVPPAVRPDDLAERCWTPQRVVDLDNHLDSSLTGSLYVLCGPVVALQIGQPGRACSADVAVELCC